MQTFQYRSLDYCGPDLSIIFSTFFFVFFSKFLFNMSVHVVSREDIAEVIRLKAQSILSNTEMSCLGSRDKIVFIKPPWTLADLLQLLDK